MMNCIKMAGVNKLYGNKQVLFDINWDIDINDPGIICLMGENGAGKSTLLKIISGVLQQNSGSIFVPDIDSSYEKWAKKNIAYIQAGERGLRLKNTVYDNTVYYGLLKGKSIKTIKENINKYAQYLRAAELLTRRCEELSMGEKKKAQILCGLCCSGKLLILDEPSTGLDVKTVFELQSTLKTLNSEQKVCIIVASHDIYFLKDIGSRYVFLHKGKIVERANKALKEKEIESYFGRLD